jgi:hypothetical protein
MTPFSHSDRMNTREDGGARLFVGSLEYVSETSKHFSIEFGIACLH